ncbi:MAG: hypothetical protein U9R37_01010 [Campylobacterota bacterium]|nr:hypothetical protein [Campylobacterota bacterium]
MNIYIYGTIAFKNQIHKILDHGNIRFKIEDGIIEEVISLKLLKELIKDDPHQIFLIEQKKIIDEDFVKKYFKFLLPKDGIEKKYLDQYGIGDISTRTYDDLIIYIEKRIDAEIKKPKASEIETIDDMFEAFEFDEDTEIDSKEKESNYG